MFLGFVNFYRRFIYNFSKVAAPLSTLLKGSKDGKKRGPFTLDERAKHAFMLLKEAFGKAPLLGHYDPEKPVLLETDASTAALAGILSQPVEKLDASSRGLWRPIVYYSRKLIPAESRYETHDQELLAIVECFKHWRHYLEGNQIPAKVLTDYNNLRYFITTKSLSRRQARWAEFLLAFDFEICYRSGKSNPADGPSRRPDYTPLNGEDSASLMLPTLQQKLRGSLTLGLYHVTCDKVQNDLNLAHKSDNSISHAYIVRENNDVLNGNANALDLEVIPSNTCNENAQQVAWICESMRRACEECSHLTGTGNLGCLVPRALAINLASDETAYSIPSETLVDAIKQLQQADAFVKQERWKVQIEKDAAGLEHAFWTLDDNGLLRFKNSIFVPRDRAIREEILKRHHDDPGAGHMGVKRTTQAISSKYFWPDLNKQVREYCKSCQICQRVKAPRHRPYGEMNALPVPVDIMEHLSYDFIIGLPPSRDRHGNACDAILVILDRFSKYAFYIATTMRLTAEQLAELFCEEIIAHYGAPKSIVSDRGSLFTSAFWESFTGYINTKRRLSTAFHPQTDGQTERQNQFLEQYLRCYTTYNQDNWASLLWLAMYAYNTSTHASTERSPAYVMRGKFPSLDPSIEANTLEKEVPAAKERAETIRQERDELIVRLQNAAAQQAKYYNEKHTLKEFRKGQKVLLRAKNIRTVKASKKLDDRLLGPFTINEPVGKQAYKLILPLKYKSIHPVFHVSLLEPYVQRAGETTPEPVDVESEPEWEVEKVLQKRQRKSGVQYLVKWQGFSDAENQWLPVSELTHCKDLLEEFEQKQSTGEAGLKPENQKEGNKKRRKKKR